jgi:hypothetical protein
MGAARAALGATITFLGLILLAYGFYVGAVNKHIGTYATVKYDNSTHKLVVEGKPAGLAKDSASLIVGWFLVLIGPAIWVGEVPKILKPGSGG